MPARLHLHGIQDAGLQAGATPVVAGIDFQRPIAAVRGAHMGQCRLAKPYKRGRSVGLFNPPSVDRTSQGRLPADSNLLAAHLLLGTTLQPHSPCCAAHLEAPQSR